MKKRSFALSLVALFMVCVVAVFASCDLWDSDDTAIKIKNDTTFSDGSTWCITKIDIKDDHNRQVYFEESLKMLPGSERTISVDEGGTYRIRLTAAKAFNGSKQAYGSHYVSNNSTLTVYFDGSDDLYFD